RIEPGTCFFWRDDRIERSVERNSRTHPAETPRENRAQGRGLLGSKPRRSDSAELDLASRGKPFERRDQSERLPQPGGIEPFSPRFCGAEVRRIRVGKRLLLSRLESPRDTPPEDPPLCNAFRLRMDKSIPKCLPRLADAPIVESIA